MLPESVQDKMSVETAQKNNTNTCVKSRLYNSSTAQIISVVQLLRYSGKMKSVRLYRTQQNLRITEY